MDQNKDFMKMEHDAQKQYNERVRTQEEQEYEKKFQHYIGLKKEWEKTATRWEAETEYIPVEDYYFKMDFRISDELGKYKQLFINFLTEKMDLGVKILVLYDRADFKKEKRVYDISLKLQVGVPLVVKDEEGYVTKIRNYDDVNDKYMEIYQSINDFIFDLEQELRFFHLDYHYFNSMWSSPTHRKEEESSVDDD